MTMINYLVFELSNFVAYFEVEVHGQIFITTT